MVLEAALAQSGLLNVESSTPLPQTDVLDQRPVYSTSPTKRKVCKQ